MLMPRNFSDALARTVSLRVHQFRGDVAAVAEHADSAVAVSEAHEFVHYIAMSLILRGWALASQGEFERGISRCRTGWKSSAPGVRCCTRPMRWDCSRTPVSRMDAVTKRSTSCARRKLKARSREQPLPVLRERDLPVVRRRLPTIGQRCNPGGAAYPERPCDRARAGFPIVPIETFVERLRSGWVTTHRLVSPAVGGALPVLQRGL